MILRDLLSTLATKDAQITLKGSNGVDLITFTAAGYEALEDSIETSDVKRWVFAGPGRAITVTLETPTTTDAEG